MSTATLVRNAIYLALAAALLGCSPSPDDQPKVTCTPLDEPVLTDCSDEPRLPLLEPDELDAGLEEWGLASDVERFVASAARTIRTLRIFVDDPAALAAVDGECIVVNHLDITLSGLQHLDALRHFDVRGNVLMHHNLQLERIVLPTVRSLQNLSVSTEPGQELTQLFLPNLHYLDRLSVGSTCNLDLGAARGEVCAEGTLDGVCPAGVLNRRTCCDGIFEGFDDVGQ